MNNHTCLFVNAMPKYIHSNINPVYTYTHTDVINMHMQTYIYINMCIYLFNKMNEMNEKESPPPFTIPIPPNLYPTLPRSVGSYKVDFFYYFQLSFEVLYFLFCAILNLSHLFRLFAATLLLNF